MLKNREAVSAGAARIRTDVDPEEQIGNLNKELQRMIVRLKDAYHELEALSYAVSHDLRAPLGHIIAFTELLNKRVGESLDEKNKRLLDVILNATWEMNRLIDDLLAFSRTGRVPLNNQIMPFEQVVKDVISDFSLQAQGRELEWDVESLPLVPGDPSLLRLVWINLISNALKFTRPRKRAAIQIGYEESAEEYIFHIRDNGVGFDMKYSDKLFTLFQRLHGRELFEGSGAGLANVQRIIHRHGGRVWAESAPDLGATFYFSLPKNVHKEE